MELARARGRGGGSGYPGGQWLGRQLGAIEGERHATLRPEQTAAQANLAFDRGRVELPALFVDRILDVFAAQTLAKESGAVFEIGDVDRDVVDVHGLDFSPWIPGSDACPRYSSVS